MESLSQQTYAFLMTILAGGVVGFLFDLYRVARSYLTPSQLATAMTDLLYWIVVTPTLFAMLLAGNWGDLRFYVLIGLAVGLVLYFQILSATVIWAAMGVLRGVGQAVGACLYWLARLVSVPLFFLRSALGIGRRGRGGIWRMQRGRFPGGARRGRLALAWQRLSFARIFSRFSP